MFYQVLLLHKNPITVYSLTAYKSPKPHFVSIYDAFVTSKKLMTLETTFKYYKKSTSFNLQQQFHIQRSKIKPSNKL
jgi:hypothetical protein